MRLIHTLRQSPLLATSLLLNVVVGVTAAIIATQQRSAPLPLTPTRPPPPVVAAAPPVLVKTKPFHWRELDAPDFGVFVANLRQIGCPELTIQDIVAGELREIYATKRAEVLRGSQTTTNRMQATMLAQLDLEQSQLLTSLLGNPIVAPPSEAPPIASALGGSITTVANPVAEIPAAFLIGNAVEQTANPQTLSETVTDRTLDPGTAGLLNQMRAQFATAVQAATAAEPNPASPVYRERWHNLKHSSDEHFSSMFGGDTFVRVQLQAAQQAAAAAK